MLTHQLVVCSFLSQAVLPGWPPVTALGIFAVESNQFGRTESAGGGHRSAGTE